MKTNVLRFALFPLLALSALPFRPSALAQGLVGLPLNTYPLQYITTDGVLRPVSSVGNPAQIPGYGQLNIQLYYATDGTASPFTPYGVSLMPSAWHASSTTPVDPFIGAAGWMPAAIFTIPTYTATAEFMIVGWTGAFADWNTAFTDGKGLFGWTGSKLSGGALAWSNGEGNSQAAPPDKPVDLPLGAAGYNGLVFQPVPEPSTFALAGLGAVMLMVFRRRR